MESDFSRFIKLKDIREVEISQELCPAEKKKEYIRQTGSSTVHKVGNVEVECVYGSMKLEKILADIICE